MDESRTTGSRADARTQASGPPSGDADRSSRRAFLRRTAAAAVGASALAGCASLTGPERTETEPPSRTERPTETPVPTETEVPDTGARVGVYLGNENALEPWENWFGRTVDYYSFNVPKGGWEGYRVPNMPFERPIEGIAADREIAVTAKMFPPGTTTLDAVARGNHTDEHRGFARSLVDNGMADATVRLAHELNGRWSPDGAVGRPELFVEAWRQAVGAMEAADGAAFDYMWAPHVGRVHMDPTDAYPGDDWVDQVGLTVYDKNQRYYPAECGTECVRLLREQNWNRLVSQAFGLEEWATFAREHDKSLAFPEYGIAARNWNGVGGGDNPLFFDRFADWVADNEDVVEWHNVWSFVAGPHFVGPSELHSSERFGPFPDASRAFKRRFGG